MTEKDAITSVMQHYIDGAKSGSSAEMSRSFHADASIFGYEGDSLVDGHWEIMNKVFHIHRPPPHAPV
jgi:hypothetical protein